jgi:TetR/AcrR family transcriptional regulator, regulator of cefoperazone and chloramphenicol sensitivity
MYGPNDRSPEDLTARARIRDAALIQFAEHGTRGATIKGIAEQAGVSPGLVQHHFGTKDNLRQACDAAVIEVLRRQTTRAVASGEITKPDFIAALYDASPPLLRYLARAAVEGGPTAAAVLDELASGAEEFLSNNWPERFPPGSRQARDAAAVMCAMHTGVIMLHDHLARQMGADLDADPTRIGLAMTDLYAAIGEFVTSETGQLMTDAVTRYRDDDKKGNR